MQAGQGASQLSQPPLSSQQQERRDQRWEEPAPNQARGLVLAEDAQEQAEEAVIGTTNPPAEARER